MGELRFVYNGTSLPPRERGLKCAESRDKRLTPVAPPAGAWIEILEKGQGIADTGVAPPAGAWIEISLAGCDIMILRVAPPAGAWIEMSQMRPSSRRPAGRSPRGSVD